MIDEIQTKEKLFSSMDEIEGKINELKEVLKNTLDVNEKIDKIISLISDVRKLKKAVINLSNDENKEFENRYRRYISKLKRLKSKHITKYNEKVSEVNRKASEFRKKVFGPTFSDDIKEIIKKIPLLMPCNLLENNSQWKENDYLRTLEYDKIKEAELIIQELESKLNIKNDDVTNKMTSIVDEIETSLKKMEQKKDLTIQEVDKYLFECNTLSGRIEYLNFMNDEFKDKISQEHFSKYNSSVVDFRNRISVIKGKLLVKKQEVSAKSFYDSIKDGVEVLEEDYTELVEMFFENETKFTKALVADYKRLMRKLSIRLEKIRKCTDETFKEGRINVKQLSNLKERFGTIMSIHSELGEKLDNVPCMQDDKKNNIDEFFATIEDDLEKLMNEISDLGIDVFKDRDARKKVEKHINSLDNSLNALETTILRFKQVDLEKYNLVQARYNECKENFEKLNQHYNEKCPLLVRKVREAKPIYKKHKKLSLISAGLASMTLLTSGYTLIPALMHGNAMLGSSVPAFNGMMTFFNKVLGSLIGASVKKNGAWVLATGTLLNGAVATTSILKFLATIGIGTATLAAPLYIPQIVLKVKQLVDKIKEYDLKQKLSDTYSSGVKKINETVEKVEKKVSEYDLRAYYKSLLNDYLDLSGVMSFDEFCNKMGLSNSDREILDRMVKLDNLITSTVENNKRKRKGTAKFA